MTYMEDFALIATICGLIYLWCKRNYSYWTRHGIPQMEPTPLIGNTKAFLTLKESFGLHLSKIYADKRFVNDEVVGIYLLHQPGLVIRDLELVKSILIKDFNKFSNRYSAADYSGDPIGCNALFFMKNPHWKEMRTKLSPVFSSGKIKQMYQLMLEISKELENYLSKQIQKSENNLVEEIKEICALFTTDIIATVAFGIRANGLQNPNSEFRSVCRKLFDFDIFRAKDAFVSFFLPKLVNMLRVRFFTEEFTTYSRETINEIMNQREKTGYQRNDLIDILMRLKKTGIFDQLNAKDNDFFVAQGASFVAAGFETSSATMSFVLYELAKRQDLQKRLREEICEAFSNDDGIISYERINTLEYLSMVVDETLRLYPILPFLDRTYTTIEDEEAFSLKPHYDYELPNGMPVYIPIFAIQRDPQYWPNPNTFDPERFSAENKKLHNPMSYIPFGTGPHNCIGMRIGLLQSKLGLVHFLKNHRVSTCEKTPKDIKFDPKSLFLQNTDGLYLKIINDQMYDKYIKNEF